MEWRRPRHSLLDSETPMNCLVIHLIPLCVIPYLDIMGDDGT